MIRLKKKKRPLLILLDLLIVVVALAGIGLLLRPYLVHRQQDNMSQQLLDNFDEGDGYVEFYPDELVVDGEDIEYFDDFDEYEDVRPVKPQTSPAATGETEPEPEPEPSQTQEKIRVKAIARIQIPKIKVDMPVAEGATKYNLRVAIGHFTPSPGLGNEGLSVLFGHRMYTYGRHFNRLGEVEIGDEIIILDKENSYSYKVDQIDRVLPQGLPEAIYTPVQGQRLMLVTCDPIRVASHRLLVRAELIDTKKLP